MDESSSGKDLFSMDLGVKEHNAVQTETLQCVAQTALKTQLLIDMHLQINSYILHVSA